MRFYSIKNWYEQQQKGKRLGWQMAQYEVYYNEQGGVIQTVSTQDENTRLSEQEL